MKFLEPQVVTYFFGDSAFTSTLYYGADARESLRRLAPKSFQCVVTSPPYWGLRDYGTGFWKGGEPACDHFANDPPSESEVRCDRCGASWTDDQIGVEQSPEDYVAELVGVFREVRRVLRDDGVLWLNLGDSYAGGNRGSPSLSGLKPKDLVGIPWAVAFALRADGWYLRSDVIWAKGNPMPESVTDRPTRSHEYVFLLTKSENYFYDSVAVKEASLSGDARKPHGKGQVSVGGRPASGSRVESNISSGVLLTRNRRSVWTINPKPYKGAHFAVMPPLLAELCIKAGSSEKGCCPTCGAPRAREAGWGPTCACPEQVPVPCKILDPFSGSGTTGFVANRLGRNYVGTDLNPDYLPLAKARILGEDPPEKNPHPLAESILDLFGVDFPPSGRSP